jgi:hypothetical protein
MDSDRAKSRIEGVFKANTAYSAFDLKVSYFEIFEISASRKNGYQALCSGLQSAENFLESSALFPR